MGWPKRKRRKKINYQGEVLNVQEPKVFNYSKMCSLLLKGTYEEFSDYARQYNMGEDWIETSWSLYRSESNGVT